MPLSSRVRLGRVAAARSTNCTHAEPAQGNLDAIADEQARWDRLVRIEHVMEQVRLGLYELPLVVGGLGARAGSARRSMAGFIASGMDVCAT